VLSREAAFRIYRSGAEATVKALLELDTKVDELNGRISRLTKNSSTSSKPPSSDIVKPSLHAQRSRDKKKLKKGGQPNHPKWSHELFAPHEVDNRIYYALDCCPQCHGRLQRLEDTLARLKQQVELLSPAVTRTEHCGIAYWCSRCGKVHYAPIPEHIRKEGLFKADISATVCFLKYVGCMSLSAIKRYLADAFEVRVTKGYLAKVIQKGTKALGPCYEQLLKALPLQTVVNSDETGHKENGAGLWTWVFRSSLFALFKISPSRGSEVLIDVLGEEFNGVLGCDYFSAYRKYMIDFDVTVQFCLAHLIRDVKYLVEFHDPVVQRYGKKILAGIRILFHTIHRRERMSPEKFKKRLERAQQILIHAATAYVPQRTEAQNIAQRFKENGEAYFTFITTPSVDPTNNCAEQAIRFVVIYRRVSQGTRSPAGRVACERFFTVVASCAMQGKSAFVFIKEAFQSYFLGKPPPSLLPASA
jgi:transposase